MFSEYAGSVDQHDAIFTTLVLFFLNAVSKGGYKKRRMVG